LQALCSSPMSLRERCAVHVGVDCDWYAPMCAQPAKHVRAFPARLDGGGDMTEAARCGAQLQRTEGREPQCLDGPQLLLPGIEHAVDPSQCAAELSCWNAHPLVHSLGPGPHNAHTFGAPQLDSPQKWLHSFSRAAKGKASPPGD